MSDHPHGNTQNEAAVSPLCAERMTRLEMSDRLPKDASEEGKTSKREQVVATQQGPSSTKSNEKLDFCCPVCLDLMIEPVKLPECCHYLCDICCKKILKMKDDQRACPLCRKAIQKSFVPNSDAQMRSTILSKFPKEVKRLKMMEAYNKNNFVPKLKIKYGNRYTKLKNPVRSKNKRHTNEHSWDAYVMFCDTKHNDKRLLKTEFVRCVVMDFSAYVKTVWGKKYLYGKRCKGWFRTGGVGWGYFPFDIDIKFAKDLNLSTIRLTHELCFEPGGDENEVEIELTSEQALKIGLIDPTDFRRRKSSK